MEDSEQLFLTASEWKSKYYSPQSKCIIWGTGQVAGEVRETLRLLETPVYAYGDNDKSRQGTFIEGCPVLAAEELQGLDDVCVLIGSYVIRPVYEQLRSLGIKHLFVLLDALKYPAEDLLREKALLAPYFPRCTSGQEKGKVMVEVYGDIGDVLIKVGLIKGLQQILGENMWLLVEDAAVAEVLRELFPHVIAAPREKLAKDRDFRLQFLQELNQQYFSSSIVLCDARLHANRRLLNSYNFNVPKVFFARVLPDQEYLPELDRALLLQIYPQLSEVDCSPMGVFGSVSWHHFPQNFPYEKQSYAVVNLGARKEVRHYSAERFGSVVDFLLSRKIPVVLIGRGEHDESWAAELVRGRHGQAVYDGVGKYSLMESISVACFARLFVGTDSGMWNVSYVTGTPSVVLYGLGEYGCFMHKAAWVHYAMAEDKSCMGCRWYCNHRADNGRTMCMDSIAPEQIIGKIREVLDDKT